MNKKLESKLTNEVRRCAIALLMAEAELMEEPLTKKQATEALDSSDLLDEAHEAVHYFHNLADDNTGKQEFEVQFNAGFVAKVYVGDGESLQDAISDIDIPTNKTSNYIEDTFEVDIVEDKNGVVIDPQKYDNEQAE